jgi:hypothetical protein
MYNFQTYSLARKAKKSFLVMFSIFLKEKGGGIRSPLLHVYYNFRQKCSKLDTVTNQDPKNQNREQQFLFLVLTILFRTHQKKKFFRSLLRSQRTFKSTFPIGNLFKVSSHIKQLLLKRSFYKLK